MRPWTVYPTTTDQPNIKVNDTGGDLLVIGGIHGDEPCGWRAIREFYRDHYQELTQPVTFLFANPQAAWQKTRYIDEDLNRLFGPQYNSGRETHEGRLAESFQPLVANFDIVISLHSTHSTNEPFAIFGPPITKPALQLLQRVGISKAVHTSKQNQRGSLIALPNVIEFECGYQHSQGAVANAKRIIRGAVAHIDGLETDSPRAQNDVQIFTLLSKIDKPDNLVNLYVDNLQTVQKGTLIAETETEKVFAPRDFAPILMSKDGYADILGYRGLEKGWLSNATCYTHQDRPNIITELDF